MPTILIEMTDPRDKNVILYEETWENHIIDGHPEMEDSFNTLVETIKNPDFIREGRNPKSEELYVKITENQSTTVYTGVFVATRDIPSSDHTIVTTAYIGDDSPRKGNIKWSKKDRSK